MCVGGGGSYGPLWMQIASHISGLAAKEDSGLSPEARWDAAKNMPLPKALELCAVLKIFAEAQMGDKFATSTIGELLSSVCSYAGIKSHAEFTRLQDAVLNGTASEDELEKLNDWIDGKRPPILLTSPSLLLHFLLCYSPPTPHRLGQGLDGGRGRHRAVHEQRGCGRRLQEKRAAGAVRQGHRTPQVRLSLLAPLL